MKVGLLCGREYAFPPAFLERVNALGRDHGITAELVKLTGARDGQPGFTFSDLRAKLLPDALCRAFPSRALTDDDFLDAAKEVRPSPAIRNGS